MATDRIAIRTDTAANWTASNPTLADGEQGHETDTGRRKVGDGTTAWTSLAYVDAELVSNGHLVGLTATQTLTNKTINGNDNTLSNLGDAAVGPVSQSGGTPTGAVIERDSNARGEYVKFADGTLICTTPESGLTYAGNPHTVLLPASFAETSSMVGVVQKITPDEDTRFASLSAVSTTALTVYTGGSAGTGVPVRTVAIGRWY